MKKISVTRVNVAKQMFENAQHLLECARRNLAIAAEIEAGTVDEPWILSVEASARAGIEHTDNATKEITDNIL